MPNGYGELYDYCQSCTLKVRRNDIKDCVLRIVNVSNLQTIYSGLDIEVIKGIFLTPDANHKIAKMLGTHVIILARDINYCWRRFVFVKELMHFFDSEDEMVSTPDEFERLLDSFSGHPSVTENGRAFLSEGRAFWMALACFCPEKNRLEFKESIKRGHIDEYGIALQLRIPEQYIKPLLSDRFPDIINKLTS